MSIQRNEPLPEWVSEKLQEAAREKRIPSVFRGLIERGLVPASYTWHKLNRVNKTKRAHRFEVEMLERYFGNP